MKRIIVIAVLVFLVCFGLAAESVEDMFSRVMSIGQALKEINISRYHEFIDRDTVRSGQGHHGRICGGAG